ncbi:Ankyrin repeat-containing protein [Cyphellophora attinorum]|uniref:Ankyrin repeat-containing protein n=1 Tax=Cyphellophora attinorum TaxID=1664694 RepID=A0A0N1P1Y6_9EURO|nr:Ankyrin repeat-containing protein [Phialophora attinorum]KPI41465.1 Ankyrin repeat-containing protein [Phialophora attinorum]
MTSETERASLLRKDQLERSLFEEKKLIDEGILKEDNPLDTTESFRILCEACRRGDLKVCQEKISEGVNINAKDRFDYTPLILASLCGNYETVQLLLESGALCERDTFQGERCLYNALNDRIRNLLLSYDYSKSTDPLQPLAAHLTSLLSREQPQTADIKVAGYEETFNLHKFVLAGRSPYFQKKLAVNPETTSWKMPLNLPPQSFGIVLKHIYLGEMPRDLGGGPGTGFTDSEVLAGIDRIVKQLEIPTNLSKMILDSSDRRLARQRRQDEVERGRAQLENWFRANVLERAIEIDSSKASDIKWDRNNGIFADVLLRADEEEDEGDVNGLDDQNTATKTRSNTNVLGIPLDSTQKSRSPSRTRHPRKSKVYPCHKAMLIRSEFFMTMFDSDFKEAQETPHLHIVSIDCSPAVLEVILTFLYTERTDFSLDLAVDVLFAADMLFLEKLKAKAAVVISTLGNGTATAMPTETEREDEFMDIYEILRAAWLTRVQRLEEFAARYIAYRLEAYIDDPDFAELVKESAERISARQETDSIELLDDIRYYLSERFRLRMEDVNFDEAIADAEETNVAVEHTSADSPRDCKHDTVQLTGEEKLEQLDARTLYDNGTEYRTEAEQFDSAIMQTGAVRTLDGEMAGDEMAADAINYQILLGKIDRLLDQLKLDA